MHDFISYQNLVTVALFYAELLVVEAQMNFVGLLHADLDSNPPYTCARVCVL